MVNIHTGREGAETAVESLEELEKLVKRVRKHGYDTPQGYEEECEEALKKLGNSLNFAQKLANENTNIKT